MLALVAPLLKRKRTTHDVAFPAVCAHHPSSFPGSLLENMENMADSLVMNIPSCLSNVRYSFKIFRLLLADPK